MAADQTTIGVDPAAGPGAAILGLVQDGKLVDSAPLIPGTTSELITAMLDHINEQAELMGDRAPSLQPLFGKVMAWLRERDAAAPISIPGGHAWSEIQPIKHRAAIMGQGRVAIGISRDVESGTYGVQYVDMGGEQRAINADTSDLFPPGSRPSPDQVLARIDFLTAESVDQSIKLLHELREAAFGSEPREMPADWAVTVQVEGETVITIGHDWISGATDFDEDVILGAAQHLLSFIGYGLPPTDFAPADEETPL